MECLQDYIGIRYCGFDEPESGFYLNDLQGMSILKLDKIANAEQVNFKGVFDAIKKRALARFGTVISNELLRRYKINKVLETLNLPTNVDTVNNQTAAVAGQYRGVVFQTTSLCNSPLKAYSFQSISIYSKAVVAGAVIKFFEILGSNSAPTMVELHSITKNLVVGWNVIPVNKEFINVDNMFVGYDATAINSPYLELSNNDCWCDCDCDGYSGWGWWWFDERVRTLGATYDTDGAIVTGENTFGFSCIMSIKCTFEKFICSNKAIFKMPLVYFLAEETMSELIYGDRLNRYSTVDIEKSQALRMEYESLRKEEMTNALQAVEFQCDECLECNQLVRSMEMRP